MYSPGGVDESHPGVRQYKEAGRLTAKVERAKQNRNELSGDEIYRVTTQATEEVMFRINYRSVITTAHVIKYKDTLYNITRVDVYEGYKRDLTLYCKKQ